MPLLDSSDARPVHFVGIAGAGMSALAELFLGRGVPVTGCDANPRRAQDLARLGVIVDAARPVARRQRARARRHLGDAEGSPGARARPGARRSGDSSRRGAG